MKRRTLLAGGAVVAALPCLIGEAVAQGVAKQEMPKEGIILVAMIKAQPGQEEAVKQVLETLVEPTRKETGCLCYDLHQSKSDKTQFMFYEQWATKAAFDAHGKMPYMKALGEKLKDKAGNVDLTFYELLK
jgi:quinol monooxygenase YgiN